jgi:hypothetical protein
VGTLGACSIECHLWKIQIKDELQLTSGPYNSLAGMIYQNHIDSSESRMDLKIEHWVYKAQIGNWKNFCHKFNNRKKSQKT